MSQPSATSSPAFTVQKSIAGSTQQSLELYHLAHDLRGPLNSILGFGELLLEGLDGPLTETQQADVAAIYQSAQHLLALINAVVDLSKLESERLTLDLGPVHLPKVLQEIALANFGSDKPAEVELIVKPPSTLPFVWGDRGRLGHMLKTLLKFAFTLKKKGAIILSVQPQAQAALIQIEVEEAKLTDDELGELFELMVKVDPLGHTKLGRGGVHLPLIRRLVEKQQGRIWVERDGDNKVTFYLSLAFMPAA
ncbi:MAG: HAMP domain-containing sensor histidine kinase [Anaerolineae bacterium]